MKYFIVILILFLAAIMQSSFLPFVTILGVNLNLTLVLVLFLITQRDFKRYWPAVVLTGLFLDVFSGQAFGTISLSLVLAAYLIDRLKRDLFGTINFTLTILLVALGSLANSLLLIIFSQLLQWKLSLPSFFSLIYVQGLEVLYNIIFAMLVYYVFKKISSKKQFR